MILNRKIHAYYVYLKFIYLVFSLLKERKMNSKYIKSRVNVSITNVIPINETSIIFLLSKML